ncbi:MAG: hypothetical protein VKK59_04045 [Vampirovibrionales bacterium]|nr:hypothetical protein [Vampirovibrionales bacterium]
MVLGAISFGASSRGLQGGSDRSGIYFSVLTRPPVTLNGIHKGSIQEPDSRKPSNLTLQQIAIFYMKRDSRMAPGDWSKIFKQINADERVLVSRLCQALRKIADCASTKERQVILYAALKQSKLINCGNPVLLIYRQLVGGSPAEIIGSVRLNGGVEKTRSQLTGSAHAGALLPTIIERLNYRGDIISSEEDSLLISALDILRGTSAKKI